LGGKNSKEIVGADTSLLSPTMDSEGTVTT